PACTWALTTQRDPPRDCAASTASSGDRAGRPSGTGMPYSANSSFDWYSCRFMRFPARNGNEKRRAAYCGAKAPVTQKRAAARGQGGGACVSLRPGTGPGVGDDTDGTNGERERTGR